MKRTIKSYVLRAGRISNRQQSALDNLLQYYEVPFTGSYWNWADLFKREAETVVEIGFGMGASLLAMAKAHPEQNFLGIEVHRAGVGSLLADVHEEKIENLRIVVHDAVEIFKQQIPPDSLAGIQIFFPDPWPKKRHHKRRLVQPELVKTMVGALKPGGFIHCATDWEDYAQQMLEVLSAEESLINSMSEGGFSPRPETRPVTKFEKRGQGLGHGVWDLIFVKK
ncbi:tRNA (guanine-N(7)-)-methyltransferase [Legionella birminghamensis]|uniref:tRNA (guanine-N(7)-)-methyltransferase n=1 Tax=Legionella birminghamensis TaxID=28083 RepID=A0A378IDW5_9GAMM|nr:tRNA (guanosine(46)-N7)-methyltransferase TrmB [Legionella birminghamensis]KTC75485.1 tRNA (guanine-N(7)-)-methyltransferase [Legionella birminghamensis]STX32711.1 tRNA (m7G46) methyltransferase, SAM-dependent [Legionella birminghamensis]